MLNFHDDALQKIVTSALSLPEARTTLTAHYAKRAHALQTDPVWGLNDAFLTQNLASYTNLLADKFYEALRADDSVPQAFAARVWLGTEATQPDRSTIVFNYATSDGNTVLLTIVDPLSKEAKLTADGLPTLAQVRPDAAEPTPYDADTLVAIAALTKLLATAGYEFASIDDTVMQPVADLTFATKYDNSKVVSGSAVVQTAGDITLTAPLNGATPLAYHVKDDAGHDWLDLGTDEHDANTFSWSSTTIPEELVGHTLTLAVTVRALDNAPALDALFVIASNNAILMKQSTTPGEYALPLPNHQTLTVTINSDADTITLGYPDPEVQLYELVVTYPFIGDWLREVLPNKRAFN